MSRPDTSADPAQHAAGPPDAVRTAWRTLRRSGIVAPELPAILFVAVASSTGFWWGLGVGAAALTGIVGVAHRQRWSSSTVVAAAVGLVVALTIARVTGVAAGGLVVDVCLDLTLGCLLAASVAVRRPLFAVLWRAGRRRPPLSRSDRGTHAAYNLATLTAAVALLVRAAALGAVYLNGEPVALLLTVKVALGLPVTLVVIAAAYAAGGIETTAPLAQEEDLRCPTS